MATPYAAKNGDRVLKKALAILFRPANGGSAREVEQDVGNARSERARTKMWLCAGEPSGGTNVTAGDMCLDVTNDDVYRYYDSAWDKLNVTT